MTARTVHLLTYMEPLIAELELAARRHRLGLLAYLLAMARAEAAEALGAACTPADQGKPDGED